MKVTMYNHALVVKGKRSKIQNEFPARGAWRRTREEAERDMNADLSILEQHVTDIECVRCEIISEDRIIKPCMVLGGVVCDNGCEYEDFEAGLRAADGEFAMLRKIYDEHQGFNVKITVEIIPD